MTVSCCDTCGYLLAAALWVSVGVVDGTVISSSQLRRCVDRGAADGISCAEKFVVAIALDGGQNNTESVLYWSSALTTDGRSARLPQPVTVKLKKSKPLVRYPIFYWQNVNAKPTETVIYTTTLRCDASPSSSTPTCGRAFAPGTGAPIPFSEGYCCECSLCDLIGFCDSQSRANTDCSLFGDGAAASCLSFSPVWYSGFSVGPAQTFFTITVTVSVPGEQDVELVVGPSQLGAVDAAHGVAIRLVGDFAAFEAPLDLTGKYLLVPYGPIGDPRVTAQPPLEWMLVDRSMVTTDGSECNKIGVSYSGFNGQGSRCSMNFGSCTGRQIDDLRAEDLAKMANGKRGDYMVSNFGEFAAFDKLMDSARQSDRKAAALEANGHPAPQPPSGLLHTFGPLEQEYYIAYVVGNVQASLLTLTVAADNISYVVNLAPGRIIQANISSFASSTRDGVLSLTVMNVGGVTADYQLSVMGCTAGTFPIQAKVASLAPLQVQTLSFNVYFQMLTGSLDSSCNVTLYDSQFAVTDFVVVRFNTTAVNFSSGAQGGDRSPPGSDILRQPSGSDCASCPFYNPLCFLGKSCFWQMLVQLLSFLMLLGGVALLIKHADVLCGLCCSKSSSKEKEKRRRRDRDREPV
jgi:hypothetical protein